jgi:hypothetical protein
MSSLARFRMSVADSLFLISRTYPKLLSWRSTPSAWTGFRILLGALGAGLVVLPLGLWNAWAFAPVGLALFLLAVLLPPLRRDRGTPQVIEQLGAYLVLDAGRFCFGPEEFASVDFYLTPTRIWALDDQLRPVAVIPVSELSLATAFPSQNDWILRLRWLEDSAEFIFDGLFAERRARIAEAGLRHLMLPEQTPRTRVKAAGA